jgi:hypothetical protein
MLFALALAAPCLAQQGALTVPRNLDQLTAGSADIVRGNVLSARVEKHPVLSGLNTVVVQMRVKETIKGQARDTFTFRQYIWDIRDISGAAGYRKGQDLLLMMIAPNEYGLSSPAGLEQGRFRIQRDSEGRELAVNGHGNFGLFDGIHAQLANKGVTLSPGMSSLVEQQPQGPLGLAELTGLIRELANTGR